MADDTGLVEQWDFFEEASETEPGFQIPWHDWRRFGDIMLSDNRGKSGHTDLAVLETLPEGVLTSPAPVDWETLIQ